MIQLIAVLVFYNFDLFRIINASLTLNGLVSLLANWIAIVAAIVAFFVFVYSGFLYLTAGGNPDQAKKGLQGIVSGIIGLVIIALAYVLLTAVLSTLMSGGGVT